jgi:predicted nucleotidyltransferase component of viral defense system
MRQYPSPAAFRAGIDTRLRNYARRVGVPVQVVRRQAALEQLMARLAHVAPGRWALKGGLALDTRLPEHARASMDMDIDHILGAAAAREDLTRAAAQDLRDHFAFAIVGTEEVQEGGSRLALRYRFEASVAGVAFESLQVDVTNLAPDVWEVERAQRPGLLSEVGLGPIDVMLVPLERQVAEKLHAYTRRYNGESTRVRDLVDLIIIRLFESLNAQRLRDEINRTFTRRGTHPVPEEFPSPPTDWARAYAEEARAVGIPPTLADAHLIAASWLNPVLQGTATGTWDPERQRWGRR